MYKTCMVFYVYVDFDEISTEIKSFAVYNLDTVCKDLPAIYRGNSVRNIEYVWYDNQRLS